MLEIIALFFLSRNIAELARSKGESPVKWVIILIIAWLLMEFVGVMVALMFFNINNLVSILLVAMGFAITGYYLVLKKLQSLPDADDDFMQ
jgi:uncharacterized RDD family membrane protein YckC